MLGLLDFEKTILQKYDKENVEFIKIKRHNSHDIGLLIHNGYTSYKDSIFITLKSVIEENEFYLSHYLSFEFNNKNFGFVQQQTDYQVVPSTILKNLELSFNKLFMIDQILKELNIIPSDLMFYEITLIVKDNKYLNNWVISLPTRTHNHLIDKGQRTYYLLEFIIMYAFNTKSFDNSIIDIINKNKSYRNIMYKSFDLCRSQIKKYYNDEDLRILYLNEKEFLKYEINRYFSKVALPEAIDGLNLFIDIELNGNSFTKLPF